MRLTVQLRPFYPHDGINVLTEIPLLRLDSEILEESSHYRLLSYVDPYGNTVFNTRQMDDLLDDLGKYRARHSDATQGDALNKLQHLAKRCKNEVHLYLQFLGD